MNYSELHKFKYVVLAKLGKVKLFLLYGSIEKILKVKYSVNNSNRNPPIYPEKCFPRNFLNTSNNIFDYQLTALSCFYFNF